MATGEVYLKWKPVGIAGKTLYIKKSWLTVTDNLGNVIGDGEITDTYDPLYIEDWEINLTKESSFVRCYRSSTKYLYINRTWQASSKAEDQAGTYPNSYEDDQRIDYFQFWLRAKIDGTWYDGYSIPCDGVYIAAINPPDISFDRLADNISTYYPYTNLRDITCCATFNPYASYKPDKNAPFAVSEWIGYNHCQPGNVEIDDFTGGFADLCWDDSRTLSFRAFRHPIVDYDLSSLSFKLSENGVQVDCETKDLSATGNEWGTLCHTICNCSNCSTTTNKTYCAEVYYNTTKLDSCTVYVPYKGIPISLEINYKGKQDTNTAKVRYRVCHTFTCNHSFKFQVGWYSGSYYDFTGYLDNNQGLITTNLACSTWSSSICGWFDGAYNIDNKPFAFRLIWAQYGQPLNNCLKMSDTCEQIIPDITVGNCQYVYNDFNSWLSS